ncbi:MAG: hypothetical protein JKY22_00300 [Flavobacteriaceae bacterium]|nr:hypothetical protein [Flavobacteriaceae bacterium]
MKSILQVAHTCQNLRTGFTWVNFRHVHLPLKKLRKDILNQMAAITAQMHVIRVKRKETTVNVQL